MTKKILGKVRKVMKIYEENFRKSEESKNKKLKKIWGKIRKAMRKLGEIWGNMRKVMKKRKAI